MIGRCDSGVHLPGKRTFTDGQFDYCMAPCGWVVRYPHHSWHDEGQQLVDAHNLLVHPARWAEIQEWRRNSAS